MFQPHFPEEDQLQQVPAQHHHLQGLPAAGPVHLLQVQCGALHVRGSHAGQHRQGVHADWPAYQDVKLDTQLVTSLGNYWINHNMLILASRLINLLFNIIGIVQADSMTQKKLDALGCIWEFLPKMSGTFALNTMFYLPKLS